MSRGSDLGRTARRRRLDLGLSQSRIADAVGVSSVQVGRWERGETAPDPDEARALADALGMDGTAVEKWLTEAEEAVLSVEIVEPGTPTLTVVEHSLAPDPWSTPPEKRITPPDLDRGALLGRPAARQNVGADGNGNGNGNRSESSAATATVTPIAPPVPAAAAERLLKRQARRDERRLRRQMIASQREEKARITAETHLRLAEEAAAARRAPIPGPAPATPAPAGAANTGTVFPVPDTRRGSETVTYQGKGEVPESRERTRYGLRVVGTITVMIILGGLLWWAFASLGDGLGAVVDLLRGGDGAIPTG